MRRLVQVKLFLSRISLAARIRLSLAENESHQANRESFVKSEEVFWNTTDAQAPR
jgi:hypothetical protein